MYSMQPSFWEKETFLSNIDIAIVGAGLVGTTSAIFLKRKYPDAKIVVFDRGFISSGASTKNAGFACFGSMSELIDDLESTSPEAVFDLLARRFEGLQHLLGLCGKEAIDYEQKGGYELFTDADQSLFTACYDRIDYFNTQIKSITGKEDTYMLINDKISSNQLSNTQQCIVNVAEGQLNPGKMMQCLYDIARKAGILFYNGVAVTSIEDQSTSVSFELSNSWTVKANRLLMANNGFASRLLPNLKLNAVRNQVLVTNKIQNLALSGAFHMHKGYYYFRDIGGRVLIGGGRHLDLENETTDSFGNNTLIEDALINLLDTVILKGTNYHIENKWSGILGVGPSKTPILEQYSKNVFLAVRLGGMGVALGSTLGRDASNLI